MHKAAQPGENVSIYWRPAPSTGEKKGTKKKTTTRHHRLNTTGTKLNKQQAAFAWGDKWTKMLSDEWTDVERQEQKLQPGYASAGLIIHEEKKL